MKHITNQLPKSDYGNKELVTELLKIAGWQTVIILQLYL